MDYGKYKNARNASWQCILDYGIDKLPVKVTDIINKSKNIRLFKDSDAHVLKNDEIGSTIFHNGVFEIVYKDTKPAYICRFTIAHELGHIFLGHVMADTPVYRTFKKTDANENAANVFARDLLAPACVLHELNILSATDIGKVCNISKPSAEIREERMEILEARNAWYLSPLERQVYKQFEPFIKSGPPVQRVVCSAPIRGCYRPVLASTLNGMTYAPLSLTTAEAVYFLFLLSGSPVNGSVYSLNVS